MGLLYFKAEELGYATAVYVRHYSEVEATKVFELFKRVEPTPEKGTLTLISWWEGWNKFRGVPADHMVVWTEFEPATDFYQYSASYGELVSKAISRE